MDSDTTIAQKQRITDILQEHHGVKISEKAINSLTLDQLKRIKAIVSER
jgi:hypothetical protein